MSAVWPILPEDLLYAGQRNASSPVLAAMVKVIDNNRFIVMTDQLCVPSVCNDPRGMATGDIEELARVTPPTRM